MLVVHFKHFMGNQLEVSWIVCDASCNFIFSQGFILKVCDWFDWRCLTLFPLSKKVLRSDPGLVPFWVEFCSAFLPQSKDVIIRIIGDSQKYELSALQWTGNLSIVYPCLSPADGWDRQKQCLTEDERMNIYLKSTDVKGESRVTSYVCKGSTCHSAETKKCGRV